MDVFSDDISYEDLKGLYQLKKLASLFVAYFATWGIHGNLVRPHSLLKMAINMGDLWLKASGGGVYQRGMKLWKFGTSSMKIVCVSFLLSPFLCVYIFLV